MVSKPEGKDEHGEERVGPVRGLNTEDRTYLNFDKVETLGTSHRNSGAGAARRQAHRIRVGLGRRHPRVLGAGIPVQARRDAQPHGEQLGQPLPGRRDHQDRGIRRPLRRDVRHLPLDDELRGSRGGSQRLQGLLAAADRRKKTNAEALHRDQPAAARGDHAPVRHPPRRVGREAKVRTPQCTSKRGCSSSLPRSSS